MLSPSCPMHQKGEVGRKRYPHAYHIISYVFHMVNAFLSEFFKLLYLKVVNI